MSTFKRVLAAVVHMDVFILGMLLNKLAGKVDM